MSKIDTEQDLLMIENAGDQKLDTRNNDIQTSQINSTCQDLTLFTQQFSNNTSKLRELSQMVPTSAKEEKVQNVYRSYLEAINFLQNEYDSLGVVLERSKKFSQRVESYLRNISTILLEQVQLAMPIQESLISDYDEDIKAIKKQYDEIVEMHEQKSEKILNIDIYHHICQVSNTIRDVAQLQVSPEVIEKLLEEQKQILEQDQVIIQIDGQIGLQNAYKEQTLEQNKNIETKIDDQNKQINEYNTKIQNTLKEIDGFHSMKQTSKDKLKTTCQDTIKKLMSNISTIYDKAKEDMNKIKDNFTKSFEEQQKSLKELSVEPVSFYKIFIIDESGSMSGAPFNSSIKAVKNILTLMKNDPNCEDSFCIIQFANTARVVSNKKLIKKAKVNEIEEKMNGGGTDFYQVFQILKDVLSQCNPTEKPQIIFLTDGYSSGKSQYLNSLQEISNQYQAKGISLFCIAYGKDVKTNDLKDCLKIINKDPMCLKMKDGTNIPTLYEIVSPEEITETFQIINSVAQFSSYQITMKTKAIQEISTQFSSQIEAQSQQQIKVLQFQIEQEKEYLKQLEDESDQQNKASSEQKIRDSYKKVLEEIQAQLNILQTQKGENQVKIQNFKTEVARLEKEKQSAQVLIDSRKKTNQSMHSLEWASRNTEKLPALIENLGFQHTSKFEEFNLTLEVSRQKKQELIVFMNEISHYIEGCKLLIDEVKKKVKRFSEIQNTGVKPNCPQIIEKYKQILNISNNTVEPYEIIKKIVFAVDSGLQKYLDDKEMNGYFEIILIKIVNQLDIIQSLKIVSTSEEDQSLLLSQFIDRLIDDTVEEPEDLKDIKAQIKENEKEIKELIKDLTEVKKGKDKDEIKDKEEEIKEKRAEKIELAKSKKEAQKQFKQDTKINRNVIERIISYLKASIDNIAYNNQKFKILLPLKHFCDKVEECRFTIKETRSLSLTNGDNQKKSIC